MISTFKSKWYVKTLPLILALPFFLLNSEKFGDVDESHATDSSRLFPCKLSVASNVLQIGETPTVKVEITNLSPSNVNFIGSLDASDVKWRFPHCYFTIEKPRLDNLEAEERCGLMNTLRPEDFVSVEPNETFSPYVEQGESRFFSSRQMSREENFRLPGTYRIQFHYSTQSNDIEDYLGDDYNAKRRQLKRLLQDVPKVKLESNVVTVEIKS